MRLRLEGLTENSCMGSKLLFQRFKIGIRYAFAAECPQRAVRWTLTSRDCFRQYLPRHGVLWSHCKFGVHVTSHMQKATKLVMGKLAIAVADSIGACFNPPAWLEEEDRVVLFVRNEHS